MVRSVAAVIQSLQQCQALEALQTPTVPGTRGTADLTTLQSDASLLLGTQHISLWQIEG